MKDDKPESKVVPSMPVPAGKTTRLAYNGSHLRLLKITKDMGNGTAVPMTLAFKSVDGKDVTATVNVQVRGLLMPRQMPAVVNQESAPAASAQVPNTQVPNAQVTTDVAPKEPAPAK